MISIATTLLLRSILIILLCVTATSAQQQGSRKTQEKQPARSSNGLGIIDAHTHTEFSGRLDKTRGVAITEEQYFEEWRRAGVVGAISHTHAERTPPAPDLRNHNVMNCLGLDAKPNASLLEEGLRSGKYGCIKIYLGYVHQYAYDKNYEPAYELAEKYDVPVVFHTGDTYSTRAKLKYADPLTIDEVAVDHPKIRFVIAHCGNPWIESAAEVAYKNRFVYLDGSALLIGNLDKMPRSKVDNYVVRPISWVFGYLEDPTKLMFGSDWPLTDIHSYVKAFKRAIPREHWQAVFHDNAARVFRLNLKPRRAAIGSKTPQ